MATVLNPPSVDVHSSSHPDTSPHPMDSAPSPPVYGLSYSPDFIASLPTLLSDPRIRAITAAQYSHIYSQYSNADVPDSVLFPFLHGLEGDNQAQNQFFLASQPAPVPRYRGLVSVVCTEDPGDSIELPSGSSSATQDSCSEGCASDGSASDSDSSDSEEDEVLVDELMDEDIATVTENNNDGEITMRIPPSDDPVLVLDKDKLQTLTTAPTQHDLPPPSAPSHSSSMLTIDTSSTSSSSTLESDTAETSLYTPTPELRKPSHLLNSTFYPHELLDISATDGPVFLKPRIPEGISL
jgi:dual specificity MAP kinase phosphatase